MILYISITISRSSALSLNVLLIFDIHELNGALFLKVSFLSTLLTRLLPATLILLFTTIHASLYYSQIDKSDLSIEVFNLIFLLTEYRPLDKSFTSTHFLLQSLIQLNHLIILIFHSVPFL